ncbi:ABC transporter permease [Ferroacidibacillus organovorans]|uniref:ABC transporter permease n=1 Tax=Ferroacidibacillus organovorans TaxID=1765683 RepID=UPI0009E684E9|nr:ABC transporter permease [Ferroacidibacillus organovorans]
MYELDGGEIIISAKDRIFHILWSIVIATGLAFLFLPLLAVFFSMPVSTLFRELNTQASYQALQLSIQTSVTALIIIIILGTPIAYWLARVNFRGQSLVRAAVQMPIVSPPAVAGVGLLLIFGQSGLLGHAFSLFGISLSFDTSAVIVAQMFISAPFYIHSAMQAFATVDGQLLSVSRTLGVSRWATFWRVTVPLAMPGLLSGAALAWGRALGEFGATMMFAGNLPGITQTLPLAIYTAMQSNFNVAVAMSALLLLVSFILLILVYTLGRNSRASRVVKQGGRQTYAKLSASQIAS